MHRKLKEFIPGRGYTKEDWDEVSDNPELTDEQLREMKPFAEVFPEMAAKIEETPKRTRGKQKTATKEMISLRVDRDVLAAYRATGAGWQGRMNDALRAGLRKPRRAAAG
jgi:uncharacterized protein (DUF4415 family)